MLVGQCPLSFLSTPHFIPQFNKNRSLKNFTPNHISYPPPPERYRRLSVVEGSVVEGNETKVSIREVARTSPHTFTSPHHQRLRRQLRIGLPMKLL